MHRPDPFDEPREFDHELPELPIPRPGEAPAERPVAAPSVGMPIGPVPLGGGASFTAAPAAEGSRELPPAAAPEEPAESDPAARFTWEIAARLTAGMLANPARSTTSVKDAMAMFDQFLHEVHSYERVASSASMSGADDIRRRLEHGAYFQTAQGRGTTDGPAEERPAAQPPARPQPTQPAPMAGYQPLPPHMRAPYLPDGLARPGYVDPLAGPDAA